MQIFYFFPPFLFAKGDLCHYYCDQLFTALPCASGMHSVCVRACFHSACCGRRLCEYIKRISGGEALKQSC